MVKLLEDYKQQGTVRELSPNERERYFSFFETAYLEDLHASEFLLIKYPRWSIISGYYAMHDVSKLFLAKKYNMKFSKPEVHAAVIQALRELIKRKDILSLIEKAEKEYDGIISLHLALLQGKDEREKSQYYTTETSDPKVNIQKASYFLEKLVKPYITLIKEMMKK